MEVSEILQLLSKSWRYNLSMYIVFLYRCKRSLIAAIRISFVSGKGGVISVSGNQATVSIMRVAEVGSGHNYVR